MGFYSYLTFHVSEDRRFRGDVILETHRTTTSTRKCCYPTCQVNIYLQGPSRTTQYEVMKKFNFLILDVARVRRHHLDVDMWMNVNNAAELNTFTNEQINQMTKILRDPRPSYDRNASSGILIFY